MPKNKKDNLESDTGSDTDSDSGSDSDSDSDPETTHNKKKMALGVGVGVALLVAGEEIEEYVNGKQVFAEIDPNEHNIHTPVGDDVFSGESVGYQGGLIPDDDWDQYRHNIFLNDDYDLLAIMGPPTCSRTTMMVSLLDNGGAERIQAEAPQLHILPINPPRGFMSFIDGDDSPEADSLNADNDAKLNELERLMDSAGTINVEGEVERAASPSIYKKINGEWAAWELVELPSIDGLIDWIKY